MDPNMMLGGAGLGLAGAGLQAYGQGQAAKGMADVQRRRLAGLSGLQNQALGNVRNEFAASNPASQLMGAAQVPNAAMQSELAKLGAAGSVQGNAGAGQQAALNSVSQHAALQNQLAAPELAQQAQQSKLSVLANQQAGVESEADRQNALYDEQMRAAAMKGLGARTAGGLLGLGGSGLAMYGMMASAPQSYETPMNGWAANQRGLA